MKLILFTLIFAITKASSHYDPEIMAKALFGPNTSGGGSNAAASPVAGSPAAAKPLFGSPAAGSPAAAKPAAASPAPAKPLFGSPAAASPVAASPAAAKGESCTASITFGGVKNKGNQQFSTALITGAKNTATFLNDALKAHNHWRQKHNVPPLTLDATLTAQAQAYCSQMAKTNIWAHSSEASRPDQGENLFQITGVIPCGNLPVDMWYEEINTPYDYVNPNEKNILLWGHFTQELWKSTTKLGCGWAKSGKKTYVCCRYSPPGNYIGEFKNNVLKP